MTPVVLVQADEVAFYPDEASYYNHEPAIVLKFEDNAWHGRTFHPSSPATKRAVFRAWRRLTRNPWADVTDLATHSVAEPGAPLQPVEPLDAEALKQAMVDSILAIDEGLRRRMSAAGGSHD